MFHKYPRGWPFVLFLLAILVTVVSVMAIERADAQRRRLELDLSATEIASALQRRATENIAVLRAGAALFAARDEVSVDEFAEFVDDLQQSGSRYGSLGMGWARWLRSGQVPLFEATLSERDRSSYTVFPAPP